MLPVTYLYTKSEQKTKISILKKWFKIDLMLTKSKAFVSEMSKGHKIRFGKW